MLRAGVVGLAVVLAGCVPMAAPDVVVSNVPLVGSDGASIGAVRVFQENTGVVLRIDAKGLPPGLHGVHLHAVGRCDAPKFTSAGAHWNPANKQHGHQNPNGARLRTDGLGDGPVLLDADGAALVFHAKADDEKTDPSGNSGDRIACAVL